MAVLPGLRFYCHFLARFAPTVSDWSRLHRIFPPASAWHALVVGKRLGHKDAAVQRAME